MTLIQRTMDMQGITTGVEVDPLYYDVRDLERDIVLSCSTRGTILVQYDVTSLRLTLSPEGGGQGRVIDITLTGEALKNKGKLPFLFRVDTTLLGLNHGLSPLSDLYFGQVLVEINNGQRTWGIGALSPDGNWTYFASCNDSKIDATGEKPSHRPIAVNPNATHVFAVKNKLTEKIRKKMFASNFSHAKCFAVVSARPSNFGYALYDERSGVEIQEYHEPHSSFNDRPNRVFVGRTDSWVKRQAGCRTAVLNSNVFDFCHGNKSAYAEFHFANTCDIAGGGIVLGEGSPAKGSYRRVYYADAFAGRHPLGERDVGITEFNKTYEHPTGLVFQPHSINEYTWRGDDEMTPDEKKEVKKWFATHVATLARKGNTLSEEALEIAKNLGIYTGK